MQAFPLDIHQRETQLDSLLYTLIQFHCTVSMVYMASANWPTPLKSIDQARQLIYKAKRLGFVTSQPVPTTTFGRPQRLFRLTRKAGERNEAVKMTAETTKTNPIFNPVAEGELRHTLGCSQFSALLHRSIGVHQGTGKAPLIVLEQFLRDHQFKSTIKIKKRSGETVEEQLDPDGFFILSINGEYQPYFVEGQRYSSRRYSTTAVKLLKTWQRRITLYKMFTSSFHKNRLTQHFERMLGKRLLPFKVLIHSFERTQVYLDNLRVVCPKDRAFQDTFFFARLEGLEQVNVLTHRCWKRTDGQRVRLVC